MGRLLSAVAVAGLMLALAGCDDGGGDEGTAGVPAASVTMTPHPSGRPVLVALPSPQQGGRLAIVGGVLGISPQGCVVLHDKYVVIAPYGSAVVEDGKTFELTGMGRFKVGDRVQGAGGYASDIPRDQVSDLVKPCLPENAGNSVTIRSLDS